MISIVMAVIVAFYLGFHLAWWLRGVVASDTAPAHTAHASDRAVVILPVEDIPIRQRRKFYTPLPRTPDQVQ